MQTKLSVPASALHPDQPFQSLVKPFAAGFHVLVSTPTGFTVGATKYGDVKNATVKLNGAEITNISISGVDLTDSENITFSTVLPVSAAGTGSLTVTADLG